MVYDKKIAEDVARILLDIKAVKLDAENPFTWTSGIKSPIQCDNRITLAHPEAREKIIAYLLDATEKFEDSWYAGEAVDTTVFVEAGDVTKMALTVLYESKEARDTATKSGMEQGMVAGYNRLEEMLKQLGMSL